ncbi:MAG: hypothetical protein ACI8XB_000419 [Patiriisocius sp.]|jgi:hypothetical protein
MKITEVKSKEDESDFFLVPRVVYKDDLNWIPHIKQDIQKIFNPLKNKLFKNGDATRWVLYDDTGNTVGRIAAFINPKTKLKSDQPTGGVGFFDSIENKDFAFALLDTAKKWLQERDIEAMDGPINFGEKNQFWGLLVKNFTDNPSYGMNYNPHYYQKYFEEYGFQTYYEQYVFKRDIYLRPQPIFYRKYNQMIKDPEFEITDVRGKSTKQIAHDFRIVLNGAWLGHADHKEMTEDAALKIAKSLKPIMDKRIIIFIYHKKIPVAFYVNIPELNEIFKHVNGNLNLWGKLKFLYHIKKGTPKTMVGIVFGVVKEWQGKGLEGGLIAWFGENVVPLKRYDSIILTWIGDFNPKMIMVSERLGAEVDRTFITYRYLFDRTKPFKRYPIVE